MNKTIYFFTQPTNLSCDKIKIDNIPTTRRYQYNLSRLCNSIEYYSILW